MKNLSGKIFNYRDEILEDIARIVGIESVRQSAQEGMPFGEGPAKALGFCLDLARNMGFKTKNVGGRAGHIEYGAGESMVGVLAHCDVVAAGDGWTKPPFSATLCGNRLYGRGTMDDKGPAIGAIYCLKALKDLSIVPKRRIRLIIGASEECGMEDMQYYFAHEPLPDFAFSPDSEYPICNREKGILHIALDAPQNGGSLLALRAGDAANIVPAQAFARLDAKDAAPLRDAAARRADSGFAYEIREAAQGVEVLCRGRGAHASVPEEGKNAAVGLALLLYDVLGDACGALVSFLAKGIGTDLSGEGLSIACSDVESGPLTVNVGTVELSGGTGRVVLDIRYPVTHDGTTLFKRAADTAAAFGLVPTLLSDSAPLFVDPESDLVKRLRHAYTAVTGKEAGLYSTGGGTYARVLGNRGVAFGAGMKPLSYYHIHAADEFLEIDAFMQHCAICLQALYELACF